MSREMLVYTILYDKWNCGRNSSFRMNYYSNTSDRTGINNNVLKKKTLQSVVGIK